MIALLFAVFGAVLFVARQDAAELIACLISRLGGGR